MEAGGSSMILQHPQKKSHHEIGKDEVGYRNLRMIGMWSDGFICVRGPRSISHEINLPASDGDKRK
jgi:hypothetical protein